jgi:sigma-B regulation protein RsbU (phosphoserine phosphatase)
MERPLETILVVDDDRASRKVLVRALTEAGYNCHESASGLEALQWVHEERPSLVLLDFNMPGMDGAQVLKRLRADADASIAQTPAIMLTGFGGEESEVLCLEAGADDFVTKPINAAVLRARIETQLRLQSMRRQLQQQNDELEAWRENLERDLAAARLTQQSLIPQKPPAMPGWEVAAAYRPVIQVGGDIYGWLRMRDERTLFWIADATGHGAAAALITTLAKLLFHHGTGEQNHPAQIMEAVNNDFRSIFGARAFMTAMCVALEPASGKASVVGAGHPPLLIARRNAPAEEIASCAPPLGLVEHSRFEETQAELAPGDSFLLYTDGLLGGGAPESRRLTPSSLASLLQSDAPSAQALLTQLLNRTAPGAGEGASPDDVAAVAVRRAL